MPPIVLTVPAATTVLPATVATAAVVVAHARRRTVGLRVLGWRLAFLAYVALVVTVTFFPFHVTLGQVHESWRAGVNTVPGRSFALVSWKLNVLMTVPLGFLLPVVSRMRHVLAVTAVGALTSTAIELLQLAQRVLLGGTRSTDVDDVIANTIGAFAGVLLFHACAALAPDRPGEAPDVSARRPDAVRAGAVRSRARRRTARHRASAVRPPSGSR